MMQTKEKLFEIAQKAGLDGYDEAMLSESEHIDELLEATAGMDPERTAQFWMDNYVPNLEDRPVFSDAAPQAPAATSAYSVVPATPEASGTVTVPFTHGGHYDFHCPQIIGSPRLCG